jgi:hypothetical protein
MVHDERTMGECIAATTSFGRSNLVDQGFFSFDLSQSNGFEDNHAR